MPGPRRAGVAGHPIAHSLSPLLHRAAYSALNLSWTYDAYDVKEGEFGAFVSAMDARWAGLSVTMPLKAEALRHVDEADPIARALGVINTIVVMSDGGRLRRVGANTDVAGVAAALRESGIERVASATLLGSGATATSAMAALTELGCSSPTVVARTTPEAEGLLRAARAIGTTPEVVSLETMTMVEAAGIAARSDVVISTIPMEAGDALGRGLVDVRSGAVLLDAIYDPPETPLAVAWTLAGGRAVSGVRMLLYQACEQVRLMTGREAPVAAMDVALVSHLSG